MISIIKKGIVSLVNAIHLKLFQHEMSDEMSKFLRHLSWSVIGGITASAVMMAVNIFAGRLMGPEEYGKYSLLLAMSQIIMIPLLFGFDVTSVIAISSSKDDKEKRENISSVLFFVLISSLIFLVIFIVISPFLLSKFSLGLTFFSITVFFAIVSGIKSILDSIVRGLHLFKYQFFGKMFEVALVVLLFLLFFGIAGKRDYIFYIVCLGAGIVLISVYFLKRIARYISAFKFSSLKKLLSFARILFIASLLGMAFNSVDKLIVAKYLSFTELGIYSAYFMMSVNLVAQLTQMFINVLLPTISGVNNGLFVKKIDKVYSIGFLPIFISLLGIIFVAIKLFGDKYGVNLGFIVSFAFLSTLQIYLTINSTIITSISKEVYKKYVIYLNIVNLAHLIFYVLMISLKAVSVQLILVLYIINVIILIVIQKRLIKSSFLQINA